MPYLGFAMLMAFVCFGGGLSWIVLRWLGYWPRMSRWSRAVSLVAGAILAIWLAQMLGTWVDSWWRPAPIIWA